MAGNLIDYRVEKGVAIFELNDPPANTYTFTIVGIDSNGVISSNTGTNTSAPTVSLTVTTPPKQ